MYIYIMRHGETFWNKEGRIQGSSDIELTDFGVELAELSAEGFYRDGIRFDRIYTSPFVRARKTARLIADRNRSETAPEPFFLVDDRLREMCFGKYEGLKLALLKDYDENIVNCFSHPDRYIPDETGESYEELFARIDDFMMRELLPLEQYAALKNVLVLCHGTVIRAFLQRIDQFDMEDFWNVRQPNCSINKIELRDGVFTSIQKQILYYESEELLHRGIL
ncbi:MAG: histidine phosphatase family protein [Lachnospiraceae bacterium]|nr:histidine phosphatase family protein [Lachnospiraceae bacterium]